MNIKKFKLYRQQDSIDCGPACLKMISKYYGKEIKIETLRKHCHRNKKGVSLLGVSESAENVGFKTIGGRFTFDQLQNEVPLPCVLFWNQDHFVVLYKILEKNIFRRQSKVFIADPRWRGFPNPCLSPT